MEERDLRGYRLAQLLGTTESQVSRWKRGLPPGSGYRKKIIRKLKLTEAEIKRLGWSEKETAGV